MYAVIIMLLGLAVLNIIPATLLRLFDASEAMIAIGVPALRTISISFLFAGFGIICSTVFQALGNAVYSMIVSIARQLAVLLPAAYLLSLTGSVNKVGKVPISIAKPYPYLCGCGGIGRRARFRFWCPRRAGSSPVIRILSRECAEQDFLHKRTITMIRESIELPKLYFRYCS